jgi:hypothetical protein
MLTKLARCDRQKDNEYVNLIVELLAVYKP